MVFRCVGRVIHGANIAAVCVMIGASVCMAIPGEVEHSASLVARQEGWRKELDRREFGFLDNYNGLLYSLEHYDADPDIHIVFDADKKDTLEFRFVRDGKAALSLKGHGQTAFASFESILYFASYEPDGTGATLSAYDLKTGELVWETTLHHEKPRGHSGYSNLVSLRFSNRREVAGEDNEDSILVTRSESYCDYVEVVDRRTGISLAVKNYRVGFSKLTADGGWIEGKGQPAFTPSTSED